MKVPNSEKHVEKALNRIKVVLAEQRKTNKWLAQQLHKDPSTVSKWCTNDAHPPLTTLRQIADILDVDIRTLLHPSKN